MVSAAAATDPTAVGEATEMEGAGVGVGVGGATEAWWRRAGGAVTLSPAMAAVEELPSPPSSPVVHSQGRKDADRKTEKNTDTDTDTERETEIQRQRETERMKERCINVF